MTSEPTPSALSGSHSGEDATLVGTHDSRATGEAPIVELRISRGDAIGRYVAMQPIGRGANGQVWSAYDSDLDRKVAIKLLTRRTEARGELRGRQLAEAQAMARIRHPNVVAVYDVGTHEGHLYIAMEFVEFDGGAATLGAWTRQSGRRRDEVLDAYAAAARGLAAAHAVGIAHRDFKPDNVLVDREGRVRVADFGLATPVDDDSHTSASGTPAYMSPEHHAGIVDAKSDQFSFCIALCEALTGHRPFVGATLAELGAATVAASIDARALALLPARVRSVVTRGLARSPADRHASMEALGEALHRARRPRWPWLAGAATIAAVAGITWSLGGAPQQRGACTRGVDRVAAVWNADQRAQIRVAHGEYVPAYADLVARHLGVRLDDYATRWSAVHDRICAATQSVAGTADPTKLARRACVEDRFAAFAGTAALVTTRELEVEAVDPLLAAMPEPAECEREDIAEWEPVPADPELATEVAAIRTRLNDVSLRYVAGDLETTDAEAQALLAAARDTGFPHLVAHAIEVVARLDDALGRTELARQHFDEATEVALAAGHDRLVATIAIDRLEHRARYPSDDLGGDQWGLLARATIARSGGEDWLFARLYAAQAGIAFNRNDFAGAMEYQKATIAAYERMPEPPRRELGIAYLESAIAAAQLSRATEAREHVALGQRLLESDDEPVAREVIRTMHLFAILDAALGRPCKSLEYFDAAITQAETIYGPRSRTTSNVSFNRALALAECGEIDEARESLARSRETWPAASDEYSVAQFELAEQAIDANAGDPAGALAHIERAIELWSANATAHARPLANAERSRAEMQLMLGQTEAVLPTLERLYRRWGAEVFAKRESMVDALVAAHALRDTDAFALWLARTESVADSGPDADLQTFVRALAWVRPDAATVRAVREARDRFAATHFDGHVRVRQMDAWLAEVAAEIPAE